MAMLIDYGGYQIGGSSRPIDGKVRLDRSFTSGIVEADFLIAIGEVPAMQAAFRKVRQPTKVVIASSTLVDVKQSDFTGFDSAATASKRGNVADTGTTEYWTVRIEYGCPADVSSNGGLRSSSVVLSKDDAGISLVTISGVYTGLAGTDARSQYNSVIMAYATSVMTALGIPFYEKTGEPSVETNISNSVCNFSITFRELIYSQTGFTYDDPQIVNQRITYTRQQSGPGDSPYQSRQTSSTVQRLRRMTVRYEAKVLKTLTTDLVAKWKLIKPWLMREAKRVLDSRTVALVEESVDHNFDENRISASLDIAGASNSDVIENRIETEDYKVEGTVLVPIWTGPMDRYVYQGPAQVQRRVIETFKIMGTKGSVPFADITEYYNPGGVTEPDGTTKAKAPQKKLISVRETRTPLVMGIFPDQMTIEEWRRETVIEYMNSPTFTR